MRPSFEGRRPDKIWETSPRLGIAVIWEMQAASAGSQVDAEGLEVAPGAFSLAGDG